MKTKLFLFVFSIFLFSNQFLFADSPLTSTDISKAYQDPIIALAKKCNGDINNEIILNFLSNKKNDVELKIAVINKLGWNISKKNNNEIFFNHLQKKNKYKNFNKFLKKADPETLICYAYIKSMDNYFNVDQAIVIAQIAKERSNKSLCIHMICALIEAQKALDNDWCKVYNLVNDVRIDDSLKKDFKDEAIHIIFNYIDLYKEECN